MRFSFVVLRIGTVPDGQASCTKPIIEGLVCEGPTFFVVLCEKRGLRWRNKNSNKTTQYVLSKLQIFIYKNDIVIITKTQQHPNPNLSPKNFGSIMNSYQTIA